jgi:epidermal growth factor receptor substrate 15
LSTEALIQVWNLCDIQKRGQLDQTEFVLAMHLLKSLIAHTIRQLPSVLPPNTLELIRSARVSARVSSTSSNASASRYNQQPPLSSAEQRPINHQYTGSSQHLQLRQQAQPQLTGQQEWTITPQDRAKFESIFNNLDKSKSGIIGAEEVVPFLTTSNLSEDALAQVWDLADVHNTGKFGKDEFSIAMYLVQQQLLGKTLPPTLPASLYPRSKETAPPTANSKPPVSSSLSDLLSLGDALGPSPQTPPISTSRSEKSVQSHLTGTRAPFVPTSSFGQSISQKPESPAPVQVSSTTDVPISAPIPQLSQQQSQLLNDPDYSNKLTTFSTENANLTNQVNSMSTQANQAKQKREQAEGELARVLATKADLQSRLASLRSEYDAQLKKSNEIQELLHSTKKETEKLTSEYSILEASYHAVKSQCQELSNQLVSDQQKNADLKDKIRFLNEETAGLKHTLEKLQKEAKQQSGFVSINKKQFAFAESERDKLQSQISQTQDSISREALAPGISESSPVPGFSSVGSPSQIPSIASPISSTNPFLSAFSQPVNQPVTFNETAAAPFNATFEERFNQLGISSPTTTTDPARSSTHNTVDTPNSSPPSSDFQYNPNNAPISSFTLPLGRPESTTSSVQNNPSMSVRGDIDISRPDSPEMTVSSEPVSGALPSEELAERATNFSISQLPIPPDNLNPINDQTLRQAPTLGRDNNLNSSSESFEIVPRNTEDPSVHSSSLNDHMSPSTESIETAKNLIGSANSEVPNVSASASQAFPNNNESPTPQDTHTQLDSTHDSMKSSGSSPWPAAPEAAGEFPPIKELEYEDDSSSSDDEEANNTHASVSAGLSNPVSAAAAPSVQGAPVSSFMTNTKESDPFDAAFDGLEEAKEEKASVQTFSNSPFASNSNASSASPFPATSHTFSGNPSIPALSAQTTPAPAFKSNSKEADPFDAAFDKLEPAMEENVSISAFGNSPFAVGGRVPSVSSQAIGTSQSAVSSPQPAQGFSFGTIEANAETSSSSKPSVFDSFPTDAPTGQNNVSPMNKDEWDSIFAGFGNEKALKPAASANEISNAFGAVSSDQQQPQQPPVSSTPNSQAVESLVKMGFDRAKARNALEKNNFNVEDASNYLLDH